MNSPISSNGTPRFSNQFSPVKHSSNSGKSEVVVKESGHIAGGKRAVVGNGDYAKRAKAACESNRTALSSLSKMFKSLLGKIFSFLRPAPAVGGARPPLSPPRLATPPAPAKPRPANPPSPPASSASSKPTPGDLKSSGEKTSQPDARTQPPFLGDIANRGQGTVTPGDSKSSVEKTSQPDVQEELSRSETPSRPMTNVLKGLTEDSKKLLKKVGEESVKSQEGIKPDAPVSRDSVLKDVLAGSVKLNKVEIEEKRKPAVPAQGDFLAEIKKPVALNKVDHAKEAEEKRLHNEKSNASSSSNVNAKLMERLNAMRQNIADDAEEADELNNFDEKSARPDEGMRIKSDAPARSPFSKNILNQGQGTVSSQKVDIEENRRPVAPAKRDLLAEIGRPAKLRKVDQANEAEEKKLHNDQRSASPLSSVDPKIMERLKAMKQDEADEADNDEWS